VIALVRTALLAVDRGATAAGDAFHERDEAFKLADAIYETLVPSAKGEAPEISRRGSSRGGERHVLSFARARGT
jgi:hypothetical protein